MVIGCMWAMLEALIDLLSFSFWESSKPLECLVFFHRVVLNVAQYKIDPPLIFQQVF